MKGRDIVKFIVSNDLLDKSCSSEIRFEDYLANDDEIDYVLLDDCRTRISLKDSSDTYLIRSGNIVSVHMNGLKQLDSFIEEDPVIDKYNRYSDTFKSWLGSINDSRSIMKRIADYANNDSNFSRNCSTYNKMMSYLEGKGASVEVLQSADIAWGQYMRQCR